MPAWLTPTGAIWLLTCALKAALLLGASWVGAALLRRATAAARHQIWTLGVVGAALLPLLCAAWPARLAASFATPFATLDAPAVIVHATPHAATWPTWLALGWAGGALAVALRIWRGHRAARRLLETATLDVPASWRDVLSTPRLPLLRSAAITSPMTIGVLRPRIVLPAAASTWSRERLRAVFLHELGHVRRRDPVIQLVAQLGCALYWWNPLAWYAAARLRLEREHACDDLVLAAGILPSSYAADLLDVARALARAPRTDAVCMVDRSWTAARLQRILDAHVPRRPRRTARFAAYAAGIAGTALLACTASPPPPPPDVATPAPHGRLTVGAPFVRAPDMVHLPVRRGTVDLARVTNEVYRRLDGLERCYARRLADAPGLAGTVVIHWVITESGTVADACITQDTVNDFALTDCVNALVREAGFPAPRGGAVDVSFPFVFAPS